MLKRIFDVVLSLFVLTLTLPVMIVIAIAVRVSDKGPAIYKSCRQGRGSSIFKLLKFRTMRLGSDEYGGISSPSDSRVFPLGQVLRSSKLDELPQFWNVLIGDMSIVGPRPENIDIVRRCYTRNQHRTLEVRPGIASPGSIFNYTHAKEYLGDACVDADYETKLLPVKLGLELAYLDNAGFVYDLRIIARTIAVILRKLLGQKHFALPPEYSIAKEKGYFRD
jgi:lipopolysaccharide/colanic/teichoic acid biosynthesis glycosyltransferase